MDVVDMPTGQSGRGVGSRLKQAREAKGISVEAVEAELHILKRHIEAIERDDYDNLPQQAFTRGFVLSYAKFLKMDADSVLSDFDASYPRQSAGASTALTDSVQSKNIAKVSRNQSTEKTSFGRLGLWLALLGLACFALFYLITTSGPRTVMEERQNTAVTPLETLSAEDAQDSQVNNGGVAAASESTNTTAPEASVDSANAQAVEPTDTAESTETVVVDPNAAPSELVFWVRRNTDITITDQTGATVMSGTKSRGEHRASGKPPFKVTISRVANVELNMDKTPQKKALRDNTQPDGSANFTLTK